MQIKFKLLSLHTISFLNNYYMQLVNNKMFTMYMICIFLFFHFINCCIVCNYLTSICCSTAFTKYLCKRCAAANSQKGNDLIDIPKSHGDPTCMYVCMYVYVWSLAHWSKLLQISQTDELMINYSRLVKLIVNPHPRKLSSSLL